MRTIIAFIISVSILCGCSERQDSISKALILRQLFSAENTVEFCADITADYGNRIHSFSVYCMADPTGDLRFRVVKPETIQNVEGTISDTGGKLEFEQKALFFDPMVFGQISPVMAPWLMVKAIRGGYIRSESDGKNGSEILIDDTFRNTQLQVIVKLDGEGVITDCEIIWSNRRIMTVCVSQFQVV